MQLDFLKKDFILRSYMNIFNDKILKYKLNLSINGDDSAQQTIEKKN